MTAQSLDFGAKIGLGTSNVHITNNPPDWIQENTEFAPSISYSVSGILDYRSSGSWGFSVEPGVIQKGWMEDKGESNENSLKLYYLQLPLMANFYLTELPVPYSYTLYKQGFLSSTKS